MAVPMQISLEEIITMLLSRVESLTMNDENNKTRFNILSRVLYKKGLISDEDIVESIREEHRMLKELGLIQELPGDDVVNATADSMLQWIRGDVAEIKRAMDEYEQKLRDAREEARKSTLTVASSDVLQQLDRLSPPPGSNRGGSKLII